MVLLAGGAAFEVGAHAGHRGVGVGALPLQLDVAGLRLFAISSRRAAIRSLVSARCWVLARTSASVTQASLSTGTSRPCQARRRIFTPASSSANL